MFLFVTTWTPTARRADEQREEANIHTTSTRLQTSWMQINMCGCTYVKNRHNLHKAVGLKLNTTYRKVYTNTISCFQRSLEDTAGGTDVESLTDTDLKTC